MEDNASHQTSRREMQSWGEVSMTTWRHGRVDWILYNYKHNGMGGELVPAQSEQHLHRPLLLCAEEPFPLLLI